MDRRHFLSAALGGTALGLMPGLSRPASAADIVETLKMFIPANPGGGWDQTGRAKIGRAHV